uniref:Preprotein-translocase subunit g n=1 Tax=Lophosiphonia teges TaxID=2007110 RepID=A0A1Z1MV68_9FLOR|nr:preprotein-translocase subunit g [Polysiphonia teges]
MIIKFLWYIFSFFTVILVLINSPNSSNTGNPMSQTQLLNIRSSQSFVQKLIVFTTFMFLAFSILLLVKF